MYLIHCDRTVSVLILVVWCWGYLFSVFMFNCKYLRKKWRTDPSMQPVPLNVGSLHYFCFYNCHSHSMVTFKGTSVCTRICAHARHFEGKHVEVLRFQPALINPQDSAVRGCLATWAWFAHLHLVAPAATVPWRLQRNAWMCKWTRSVNAVCVCVSPAWREYGEAGEIRDPHG